MINDTISCPVYMHAETNAQAAALVSENLTLSYSELEVRIRRCAAVFRDSGIEKGDRIAVIAHNSIEYAILIFAAYRSGVTLAAINVRLGPDYWRDCIMKIAPTALVVDREHTQFADDLSIGYMTLQDIGGEGNAPDTVDPLSVSHEIPAEQEASVIFTSGSSGDPKGVVLTLGNHFSNALASNENIKLAPDDCWLAALPFYHVGGMSILFRTALAGCSAYISDSFSPDAVNMLIDSGKVTHLSLVPTMLESLLSSRGMVEFPESLRAILLGGAELPQRLIERSKKLRAPVLPTYGLTEAASQVCTVPPQCPPDKLLSSGLPLKYTEIKIIDDTGAAAESGVFGEICIKGAKVFKGYVGIDRSDGFDIDGWFHTRDIGFFDDDSYLHIVGRKDDMFISGGENIHPAQIEKVVLSLAGVTECAVIGVKDEKWGARPVLFICQDESGFDPADVQKHLEANLPDILIPDSIIELDQLPRTSIGKIDKKQLQYLRQQNRNT